MEGIGGVLVNTLEVTDPRARVKRAIIVGSTIVDIVMGGVLAVFLWTIFEDLLIPALIFIWMVSMGILGYILLDSTLGRSGKPVRIYQDGIEFQLGKFDRMRGMSNYLSKMDISDVEVVKLDYSSQPRRLQGLDGLKDLHIHTTGNKTYSTGDRDQNDIAMVTDFIQRSWKIDVKNREINMRTGKEVISQDRAKKARKIAVASQPEIKTCPGCGIAMGAGSRFCPSCGYSFVGRSGPAPPSSLGNPPANQKMKPLEMQKSPHMALMLSSLGILGIMGLGHFYVRKIVKGAVLLLLGFFLAALAYVSLLGIGMDDQYSLAVEVMTSAMFWALFLGVLSWQAWDAFKSAKIFNMVK